MSNRVAGLREHNELAGALLEAVRQACAGANTLRPRGAARVGNAPRRKASSFGRACVTTGALAVLVSTPHEGLAETDGLALERPGVVLAPSPRGGLGAWLVAGPFPAATQALDRPPVGVDERAPVVLHGSLGTTAWRLASSADGPVDLKAALGGPAANVVGYVAGVLRVERAGRYLLLLGVDDGVRVSVDGSVVFRRDEARPLRDDDDVIALDLAAGDHDLRLKLHQRDGAWLFRARVVDEALASTTRLSLHLPGTTDADARALAGAMASISLDRVFDGAANPPLYRPKLMVRYPEGAPRGIELGVGVRLASSFDVDAGAVPVTDTGVGEIVVALPPVAPSAEIRTIEATVAGRVAEATLSSRAASEHALAHATRALAGLDQALVRAVGAATSVKVPEAAVSWLPAASLESVMYLTRRLSRLVARGDADADAQEEEARELDGLAGALDRKVDPYAGRTGAMRRAIRSPIDGAPTELGLYVPPSFVPAESRRFPLVVGLHGLNGHTMSMMRWLFGSDTPKRLPTGVKHDQAWEDRHVGPLPRVDAFVITPDGHGNAMYRELGESDVLAAIRWALDTFPIDPARITITGPSMGGIGAGGIPLRTPTVFAAAAPLCGYHSYFVRRDVAGRPIRPWERFLAEERSNAFWGENGENLPLLVVHGTLDLPEANSGVLIDRYEKLGFSIHHEHPALGHDVWHATYAGLRGLGWLATHRRPVAPRHVRFRTTRTRWRTSDWIAIDELASEAGWGDVEADISSVSTRADRDGSRTPVEIKARTSGIDGLTIRRDDPLIGAESTVHVIIDGQPLAFDPGEALTMHREQDGARRVWKRGATVHDRPVKAGTITGPLRDVFYEPILFVWDASGDDAHANELVARALSRIRPGVHVTYPVMSDAEFIARGEPLANDRALFLIGRNNRVLAALERVAPFPLHIGPGWVTVGPQRFTGRELGAAFIYPNPTRPDRYVVTVAGADVPGTLRALSLPELLPDFVVWDESVAPSRGQLLLGAGSVRAAGFFHKDWSLPDTFADPLAATPRPGARSEYDATPYLP